MIRWESFPALAEIKGLIHAFTLRQAGIEMSTNRREALGRLEGMFSGLQMELRLAAAQIFEAEQVHGDGLAWVRSETDSRQKTAAVDGLLSEGEGTILKILVADCCAVYLVDPRQRRLALVHSGRKGTELEIAGKTLDAMIERGTRAEDVVAQLSPCIGPPHYEIDFAAAIARQLHGRGVPTKQIHNPPANTGAELDRYYSYRMEQGKTGRMMALLGWR